MNDYETNPEDITNLEGEIEKLRSLVAAADGSPSLQNNLICSITKTIAEYDRQRLRHGRLLGVDALNRFAKSFVERIQFELGRVPDDDLRESIIENLIEFIPTLIKDSRNLPPEIRAIESGKR